MQERSERTASALASLGFFLGGYSQLKRRRNFTTVFQCRDRFVILGIEYQSRDFRGEAPLRDGGGFAETRAKRNAAQIERTFENSHHTNCCFASGESPHFLGSGGVELILKLSHENTPVGIPRCQNDSRAFGLRRILQQNVQRWTLALN